MTSTQEAYKDPEKNIGEVVLDVRDLRTYLYTRWGITKAVDGLNSVSYTHLTLPTTPYV